MRNLAMTPNALTATPNQQFDTIYRDHSRQITTYIATRLYRTDRYLAEDLTSETFLRLWRSLTAGLHVEHPRALLATIAERAIADHFRRASSRETATDFTASTTTPVIAGAADSPHLTGLLAELEDATDHLTQAATAYKAVNSQYAVACAALANAREPETVARAERRKARTQLLRTAAITEFAIAGRTVAQARAAWNQTAVYMHDAPAPEPLPKRKPGETFRKPPATVRPKPVPQKSAAA